MSSPTNPSAEITDPISHTLRTAICTRYTGVAESAPAARPSHRRDTPAGASAAGPPSRPARRLTVLPRSGSQSVRRASRRWIRSRSRTMRVRSSGIVVPGTVSVPSASPGVDKHPHLTPLQPFHRAPRKARSTVVAAGLPLVGRQRRVGRRGLGRSGA